MKIRTLGEQLTFYDDDFNVIGEFPERPPEDPNAEVRMINIVDFEDRLMGIDPNAKPDFFIDFDTDERFKFLEEMEEDEPIKIYGFDVFLKTCCLLACVFGALVIGFSSGIDVVHHITGM